MGLSNHQGQQHISSALQVAFNQIREGVVIADLSGQVCFMNRVAQELLGHEAQTKVDTSISLNELLTFVNQDTGVVVRPTMDELLSPHYIELLEEQTYMRRLPDYDFPFVMEAVVSKVAMEDDNQDVPKLVTLTFKDDSQRIALLASVKFHRKCDGLTGLANRFEFEHQLQEYIQDAKVNHRTHCVCLTNIDQMKLINDSVGHVAGDELIRQVASRLKNSIRSNDILARLGGDEFALLLWKVDVKTASEIVDKFRQSISDFQFSWDDKNFVISASFGLVSIDSRTDSWVSVLSQADSACQQAKLDGRNQVKVYCEQDSQLLMYRSQVEWVSKLATAIQDERFELFQQKVIGLGNYENESHYEFLIRLREVDGSIISPALFLPAAERYSLATIIDRWVIRSAFTWLSGNSHLPIKHININLSGLSIVQKEFFTYLMDLFKKYQVPPEKVCFEITETAAIENFNKAREFIARVKSLGCYIALDDFGSGMCSFAYLKNLPVDYVKIDGEFVKGLGDDEVSYTMVKSINDIAHVMGLKTIAEFVENKAIEDVLETIGVDYAQGYGIQKPIPLSKLAPYPAQMNQRDEKMISTTVVKT